MLRMHMEPTDEGGGVVEQRTCLVTSCWAPTQTVSGGDEEEETSDDNDDDHDDGQQQEENEHKRKR